MGTATIVSHLGNSLYRIKLDYNVAPIDAELEQIEKDEEGYFDVLDSSVIKRRELWYGVLNAEIAMNEVIKQWMEGLIGQEVQDPPPEADPPPEHPNVEEAWLAALNGERDTPVERDAALDHAVEQLLHVLAASGRLSDERSSPERRAINAGYSYDPEYGVGALIQAGASSAADALEALLRAPENAELLSAEHWTDAGVAYLWWPENPYTHFWACYLATPGTAGPSWIWPEEDPAQAADEEQSAELKKIPLPTSDTTPEQLSAACAEFAAAVARWRAADQAVTTLRSAHEGRLKRRDVLQALKARAGETRSAWCCVQALGYAPGKAVAVAEVPGYLTDEVVIVPSLGALNHPPSMLGFAESMSDAGVFVNLALEPGWARWQPTWRFGTATGRGSSSGARVTISGAGSVVRRLPDEYDAFSAGATSYDNVPFAMDCPNAIQIGDAVLLAFTAQDPDRPVIVGARSHPRECPADCGGGYRCAWSQLR